MSEPSALAGGSDSTSVPEVAATEEAADTVALITTPGKDPMDELRAENEQLKASIRLTEAHRQITGELTKAGARSPRLLFDSIKADLQFAEDGTAANAAALIERLKTGFPEQFGYQHASGSIDGGAGVSAAPRLTREALATMKTEEIAALDWADVKRVLSEKYDVLSPGVLSPGVLSAAV